MFALNDPGFGAFAGLAAFAAGLGVAVAPFFGSLLARAWTVSSEARPPSGFAEGAEAAADLATLAASFFATSALTLSLMACWSYLLLKLAAM